MKQNILLALLFSIGAYSQKENVIQNPISPASFNKATMQQINFMVLGDNNIKQGFSYEYKEKNSELSLNANLASFRSHFITVDGEFSVDDGIYVFDENDGSKKAKISLNLFLPVSILNKRAYPAHTGNADSNISNRSIIINDAELKILRNKNIETLLDLHIIMETFDLPVSELKIIEPEFWKFWKNANSNNKFYPELYTFIRRFNEDSIKTYKIRRNDSIMSKIKKYLGKDSEYSNLNDVDSVRKLYVKKLRDNGYDIPVKASIQDKTERGRYQQMLVEKPIASDSRITNRVNVFEIIKLEGKNSNATYIFPKDLNILQLLKDYDTIYKTVKEFDEKKTDMEIKKFKDIWTVYKTAYIGISPFYERQGMDIYQSETSLIAFKDMFHTTTGDLFGGRFSFNYVRSMKKGSFAMLRLLTTFGRGSNFNEFEKKEYSYSTISTTIDGEPVFVENKKTGYTHKTGAIYDYGFVQKYNVEFYASLSSIGVYGKIGYEKNESLINREFYPLETGIILNLKSEKKSIVSLLLFVSRQNLNVHPDDDMNLGFKIGLPIFINKNQK